MVKLVKLMIGLTAAFLLFMVVSNHISEYKAEYNDELTSTHTKPGEEVEVEIPKD